MPGSSALPPQHTSKQTKISPETRTVSRVQAPDLWGIYFIWYRGFTIAIPVAISVFLTIAIILAILTVTIVVTILFLLKIQTINYSTKIRKFIIICQFIDQGKLCFSSIICTTYIDR